MEISYYNILITPSSSLFEPTLVAMMYAILNCKLKCHFYIMQPDWSEQQKKQCRKLAEQHPGNTVDIINVDDSEFHIFQPWKGHYTVCYNLLSHLYLPETVDRILYIESDVLIRKDIYKFYSMDFEDKYYIAVNTRAEVKVTEKNNVWFETKRSERLSLSFSKSNPGSMMINIKKFRDSKVDTQFYLNYINEINNTYASVESLLNYIFGDERVYVQAYKYGAMIGMIENYRYVFTFGKEERKEKFSEDYIDDLNKNEELSILHMVNSKIGDKPWNCFYDRDKNVMISSRWRRANKTEFPYYKEWWETARRLPVEMYESILFHSIKTVYIDKLKDDVLFSANALNFFKDLAYDQLQDKRFLTFFDSLKNKKISILKEQDAVGKYMLKYAEANNINVVFSTKKYSLKLLDAKEWNECKKADVIVNACVHGSTTDERDGIKTIMLKDILSDSSILPIMTENKKDINDYMASDKSVDLNNTRLMLIDKMNKLTAQLQISNQIRDLSVLLNEYMKAAEQELK